MIESVSGLNSSSTAMSIGSIGLFTITFFATTGFFTATIFGLRRFANRPGVDFIKSSKIEIASVAVILSVGFFFNSFWQKLFEFVDKSPRSGSFSIIACSRVARLSDERKGCFLVKSSTSVTPALKISLFCVADD